MANLPPKGSDRYDDLMDEARSLAARVKHEHGECDPSNCAYCEAERTTCFYCGDPVERPDLGVACNSCWKGFNL